MIKFQITMFILYILATQIQAETQLQYQRINNNVKYSIESNETLFVIAFRDQEEIREYLFCRIKNCECEERVAIGQRSHPKLNDQQWISNYQCQDQKMRFERKDNSFEPYIWSGYEQNKQIRIAQETSTTSTSTGNTDYTDSDMTASLTVDSLFSMKWKFNTDDTIEMCYILNQKSWIGIGFGEGMKNVDMLTINIIDQKAEVLDLWSTKDDTPATDSIQDISLISYSISDSVFKARIKRKLSTSDTSQDTILAKAGQYTWSYATSSNLVMEDHGHNFQEFSVTLSETGNYVSYQNILHIFIMILYLLQ